MKIGDVVGGKYRLRSKLGEGAMGVVWSATNELTHREVALKLILRSGEDLRHRLLREARACGSLSHRNIIEILDVGMTDKGDPFLVMPRLSGETLAERLKRPPRLEARVAAQLARDIARALEVAHAASIIHRDLKPANIFLHEEVGFDGFIVKVLDFGVSKNLAAQDAALTVAGGLIGSPGYMAPEQILMARDLDQRTDLWSLGVIFYQMLAGARPFQGGVQDVVDNILSGPIPLVSDRVRGIDPAIVAIISGCLQRDRARRYQSASEIVAALSSFLNNGSGPLGEQSPIDDIDEDNIATRPIRLDMIAAMGNRPLDGASTGIRGPEPSHTRGAVAAPAIDASPGLEGTTERILLPRYTLGNAAAHSRPLEQAPRSFSHFEQHQSPISTAGRAAGIDDVPDEMGPRGTFAINRTRVPTDSSSTSAAAALVQSTGVGHRPFLSDIDDGPSSRTINRNQLLVAVMGLAIAVFVGAAIIFAGIIR